MIRSGSKAPLLFAVALGGVLLMASCVSGPPSKPYLDNKKLDVGTFLSPETGVLIFGHVHLTNMFGGQDPSFRYEFAQIHPEYDAMLVSPGCIGSAFYLQPVPVGSVMHVATYQYKSGNTLFYGNANLQKRYDITVTASKPGLLYAGSWALTSKSEKVSLATPADYGFHPSEKGNELDALKAILPYFKKSVWESLINERIEELSK